jgi:hypothetical protein
MSLNRFRVIPGPAQRVRPKAGPMAGSGRNPESSHTECVSGFRVRRFAASRNDGACRGEVDR